MERIAKLISFKSTGDLGIQINFPYNTVDVQRMHTLDGRKFHGNQKCWSCALTSDNLSKLNDWGFESDPRLDEYGKKPVRGKIKQVSEIKGLRKKLYPFQEDGVAFIEACNGRTLLADEMGLGKTVQALAWLQMHPQLRPAVIVVPASLKLNWAKEARVWMDRPDVQILYGSGECDSWTNDIIVINYDILKNWVTDLRELNPKVLIIDECHFIKNNKAQRTKAVKRLAKGIPHVIALSGTPIMNRPVEIYNAVRLVDPVLLPELWTFGKRYCGLKHNGFGWDWNGATNTKELHDLLTSSVMIRRLKKDVLKDLPDKTRSFVPMEIDNRSDYVNAEENFIDFIRNRKGLEAAVKASKAAHLVQIEALKQLAVHGKIKQVMSWIDDFLDVGEKLVVFAIHHNVIDELMEKFGDIAVKIDGRMTGQQKEDSKDMFQTSDDIRLLIGQIQAAGTGYTFTAASHAAIIELPWTPSQLSQAEDRLHRITQENAVTIHYLLAQDTIEEKMARLLDKKAEVVAAVTDGEDVQQESLLTELMNEYLN